MPATVYRARKALFVLHWAQYSPRYAPPESLSLTQPQGKGLAARVLLAATAFLDRLSHALMARSTHYSAESHWKAAHLAQPEDFAQTARLVPPHANPDSSTIEPGRPLSLHVFNVRLVAIVWPQPPLASVRHWHAPLAITEVLRAPLSPATAVHALAAAFA